MNFFLIKEYILYYHLKTDEHSLQSSFFYQFYLEYIKRKSSSNQWDIIENSRKRLLNDHSKIEIFDLGAGSKVNNSHRRKIKSVARYSLSSPKFSQLLSLLVKGFKCKQVIELGTSLGINTAYLATAKTDCQITTFEADPAALKIAKEINANRKNIHFQKGDIAYLLPEYLHKSNPKIDLVYADANHTYAASIEYFNIILPYITKNSIYVMDDIHWSSGMKKAWEELKKRDEVSSSIDLFDAGLLFFNPDFKKQHYILEF
ncbi:Methyltransferase domain-containing protein [Marivirga sericea]|uniref:Methyltransferase domain-containing protein n=1 Tax=Marivirga sericea TaxID=1028 RepID=A0A1X7ILB1_9BACT|nr:class I SAM-dependent methyltransferase [Marivirga sericea]SMG15764.1 Methyltransferase domain-containing protein [Marivirga sericea]